MSGSGILVSSRSEKYLSHGSFYIVAQDAGNNDGDGGDAIFLPLVAVSKRIAADICVWASRRCEMSGHCLSPNTGGESSADLGAAKHPSIK